MSDDSDECSSSTAAVYNQGLHIAGIFIIFGTSSLGVLMPLVGKHVPRLAMHPFALVLGKCAGIGILIACALIHMLSPATEELSNPCLSDAFLVDYDAYPFLFAMLAMLGMHFLDHVVEAAIVSKLRKAQETTTDGKELPAPGQSDPHTMQLPGAVQKNKVLDTCEDDEETGRADLVSTCSAAEGGCESGTPTSSHSTDETASPRVTSDTCPSPVGTRESSPSLDVPATVVFHVTSHSEPSTPKDKSRATSDCDAVAIAVDTTTITPHHTKSISHDHSVVKKQVAHSHSHHGHGHGHGHDDASAGHSHVHSVLLIEGMQRTVSAYLLEFGVSVHSVLIGLTTGVAAAAQLKTLLIALSFHQLFEGVALGARIADAELVSTCEQVILASIFVLSFPIGMAIGVGATTTLDPDGATYNYVAGIFDAICAGILLYIGLVMLLKDFQADLEKHAKGSARKQAGMFLAMWIAAGVMAFLGKYA